jgi:outer membrane protein OmpA-like peptidoglycan-associated protein
MQASARLPIWLILLVSILVLGISGCSFTWSPQPRSRTLFLPVAPASVLIIITDPDSPSAMRATGVLVAASARPGERAVILSSRGGAILASSRAPTSHSLQVPSPPARLPSHPTSFQKARYQQAFQLYRNRVRHARAAFMAKQHEGLARWARSMVAWMEAHPVLQTARAADISVDLDVAVSVLSSLRQTGVGADTPTVIVIIGMDMTNAPPASTPPASLQSSTVVVDDFAGSPDEQAAWQASLIQGGAARAVILTPATDNQLAPVVEQGLDGAITDTLTSVLFGLGQDQLSAAALPQLRHLLRLLTVEHPHATATIYGYTDNLPIPGGNIILSRQRAQAVEEWLLARGVAADRLQAFGYGDTDPVAPNTSHGQPLNRRVVVVIDPAVAV